MLDNPIFLYYNSVIDNNGEKQMSEFKVGDEVKVTYSGYAVDLVRFKGAVGIITASATRGYDWVVDFPESSYAFYNHELASVKPFSKSDLKTGMVVVLRSGNHYFAALDCFSEEVEEDGFLLRNGGWCQLSAYDEDLSNSSGHLFLDIVEVYSVYANDMLTLVRGSLPLKKELLYKREEVVVIPKVKMTQAAIEEALGYEIEVVSMGEEG